MKTAEERQLGRAKNAALAYLERKLSIPKIYINAIWDGHDVDVLAIDRDGVGDVHVVLLFAINVSSDTAALFKDLTQAIEPLMDRFSIIPAQYKYIAAVNTNPNGLIALFGLPHPIAEKSFAPDGIGRIGFLTIDEAPDGELHAKIVFKPERFRAKIAKLADEYVEQHTADWEMRA